MITEAKSCYHCGKTITALDSNLLDKQTDRLGQNFVIETVIIQCPEGHKNPIGVNHEV